MPQIRKGEFERLPLRVHDFLAGVPLHDVWAIDLPRTRSGITLDEFLRMTGPRQFDLSLAARTLLNIRLFVGRVLGWDCEPGATICALEKVAEYAFQARSRRSAQYFLFFRFVHELLILGG